MSETPTREQFVGWMADRFIGCGGFKVEEREAAVRYADDCLKGDLELDEVEFGADDACWDWSEAGAHHLADEDMSLWEG